MSYCAILSLLRTFGLMVKQQLWNVSVLIEENDTLKTIVWYLWVILRRDGGLFPIIFLMAFLSRRYVYMTIGVPLKGSVLFPTKIANSKSASTPNKGVETELVTGNPTRNLTIMLWLCERRFGLSATLSLLQPPPPPPLSVAGDAGIVHKPARSTLKYGSLMWGIRDLSFLALRSKICKISTPYVYCWRNEDICNM